MYNKSKNPTFIHTILQYRIGIPHPYYTLSTVYHILTTLQYCMYSILHPYYTKYGIPHPYYTTLVCRCIYHIHTTLQYGIYQIHIITYSTVYPIHTSLQNGVPHPYHMYSKVTVSSRETVSLSVPMFLNL